ncbi:hypothetical protein LTR10_019096 [Elasticomyces elasticus]|uniref:C2H2-type domain-containing protein n=1 Tax=Exophiala sideris TaxID=1016849 RepID=A0ABR0JH51_9EURO|nr:hypothetical protein LTR10_019096 [Elasticomyces elasticus]KAK5033496.1 hypothetical protein LTS07_003800 [Exophiala sideris]KAK5042009.1 hypothetical protein LTR13_001815 [Exophiala sideris]KAK5064040.1 hypothetical protein LTR69_003808 [Exophiala sideris]KAK5185277.1 hypothetical protein LTR44_002266 [Eurotiomycetes sp. CCFEE 6388]
MSYTSMPGYGDYYDSGNQGQNMQNSYNTGRQTNAIEPYTSQNSYSRDSRQSQYGSSGYEWSGQTQQNYADNSRQQAYSSASWKDDNNSTTAYGDSRQASTHTPQPTAGSSRQDYYNSQSTKSASQNTQGLNSLAYASGLDDSGLQRQSRVQHSSVSSSTKYPSSTTNAPNRVQSPLAQNAPHYNSSQAGGYNYQNNSATNTSKQSAAATALAGAVNRRFPHAASAQSVSPVLDRAAPQPSASQYYHPNTQDQRHPSSHSQQNSHLVAANSNRPVTHQMSQDRLGQHVRAPSRGAQQTSNQSQQQAPQVNSISNLVSHSTEESSHTQYSTVAEQQSTMPSYIDPTQVFNPFAKEHERRRRELEAEAKRKAEEEAAAKRREEEAAAAAAKKREEEEAAARKRQEEDAAAARKQQEEQDASRERQEEESAAAAAAALKANESSKQVNKQSESTPKSRKRKAAAQSDEQPSNSQTGEADMATELKVMMEKMKEFRSKDPTLFQKLWDDMRKPTVPVQSPSPQLPQQQAVPGPQPPPRPAAVPLSVAQSSEFNFVPSSTSANITVPRPLNGYRVVVENNQDDLPDLGRFPAERRIRRSYVTKRDVRHGTPTTPKASSPVKNTPPSSVPISQTGTLNPASAGQPGQPTPVSAPQWNVPTSSIAPPAKTPLLTQGFPPRGPTGGTIWPEEKRNALAEAAVKALKANPANEQVNIGPADIHAMLQKNPGYIDLCQMLEEKGFKFHRGQFARQLLSNVPYLNGPPGVAPPTQLQPQPQPQPHSHPSPIVPPAAAATASQVQIPVQNPVPVPVPQPVSVLGPPHASISTLNGPRNDPRVAVAPPLQRVILPQFRGVNGPVPIFKPEYPGLAQQGAKVARPNSVKATAAPRHEPPQGSKEAKARKRDFSEIVDLTALSDDEDYVLSRKQARVESLSPEPDPFQEYQRQKTSALHPATTAIPTPGMVPSQRGHAFSYTLSSGAPLKFNAGPIHQYEARPPPPTLQPAPMPTKSTKILAKSINKDEALQKTYYNPKTVALDILIAAGRHPTERPLNAHMAGLLGKHIDLDSDLSTFDWDAVDPGGPQLPQVEVVDVPIAPPRFQFGKRRVEISLAIDQAVNAESRLPDSDKRQLPAPTQVHANSVTRQDRFTPQSHLNQVNQPPRSSTVRGSSPAKSGLQNVISARRQTRNPSVASPTEPLGQHQRSTRSSSTQLRPSIEVDKPQQMETAPLFPSGKRRGRPPGAKNIHPSVRELKAGSNQPAQISVSVPLPSSPSLPLFRCRWKGCKAHLHNLETLRQHVTKVHRPSEDERKDYGYICWWRKCKYLKEDKDGLIHPEKTFDDASEWLEHIEEDHLYPVAMKLGDGPSTKHIDPQTILQDRTRYLSDENGRLTTPTSSETLQEDLEPDTMTLFKADWDEHEEGTQRSFMKTHRVEKNRPRAVAEETLRAMSARKAKIGPGLERGGCILVTEARRKTLLQNQGLARVVDADY